jgi:hypothetical protein
MMAISRVIILVTLVAALSGTAVSADVLSQDFESGWTASGTIVFGNYADGTGWEVTDAMIENATPPPFPLPPHTGTFAAWLNDLDDPTTTTLSTPLLSNGVGRLSYWIRDYKSTGHNVWVLERSDDGITYDTPPLLTLTNDSTTWTALTNTLNIYDSVYVRWRKTDDAGGGQLLGIDDISLSIPPAAVGFLDTGTDPATVRVDSPFDIVSTITPYGDVTGLIATSYWRVASGPWTAVQMTNSGANVWRSATPVPDQAFGTRVHFYVQAWFSGTEAELPAIDPVGGAGAAYYVDTKQRPYVSGFNSMNVVDDLSASMVQIADYTWEGVAESAVPLIDAAFHFQGEDTNVVTHTWGDSTPPSGAMPLRDTAQKRQQR